MNNDTLSLPLRRDRGYSYFPDVIAEVLRKKSSEGWRDLKAECFKTTNRCLYLEENTSLGHGPDLFARLRWREQGGERSILVREMANENADRYDLKEPSFRFSLRPLTLTTEGKAGDFPSRFHRWAVLCKKLYENLESEAGLRMFLMRVTSKTGEDRLPAEEQVRLELLTKDHFARLTIWERGNCLGEVIAAGRLMSGVNP